MESLGPYLLGGDALTAQSLADRRQALASPVHAPSYAGQLLASAAWSSLPWLGFLPQPTLLMAGDRDPLVPAHNATMMAALMRRSRLRLVRGGGHLLVVDRAGEVADAVTGFLRPV